MKAKNFLYIAMAAAIIPAASCKKLLDQEPQTALTQDQAFSKLANIQPLISGMFTNWRNTRKDRGGFVFTMGSDEAQQGAYQVNTSGDQAGLDLYNGFMVPSNSALTSQWEQRWPIVNAAAQAVYALNNNKEDSTVRLELLGEASFVRASVMFELAQLWGAIPIIDVARQDALGRGRQPLKDVYAFIINDLQVAVAHLPETQSDKSRVTKYAAYALLGKAYLYAPAESEARDYQKAADAFNAVITSGKYSLLTNYNDLWDPNHANSTESIYEFQFNNTYPDNNQCQWQTGSRALANVDGLCYFGGYDLLMPTDYCDSTVDKGGVWEAGDVRRDASIRFDFHYNGVVPPLPGGFGGDELNPHIKKFEDPRTQGVVTFWNSGKDIFYIRYADVLLNYAECLNELGRTADAVNVTKQVRNRAFGGTVPPALDWSTGMSQDEFRTKMLDERMRELCFEGWRRMDLIRSTHFVDYIKTRNEWAKKSGTIQPFHALYPIPLNEILQNLEIPASAQNPGYSD